MAGADPARQRCETLLRYFVAQYDHAQVERDNYEAADMGKVSRVLICDGWRNKVEAALAMWMTLESDITPEACFELLDFDQARDALMSRFREAPAES